MGNGTVTGLYLAPAKSEPMISVGQVQAVESRGLAGDRYYLGTGFYSGVAGWGAQVTLIKSEAIAAVNAGYQTDFTGAMLRRNIVTSNIDLDALIGREFRCGEAILRGTKAFPPCAHLAYLLGRKEVLKYFAYCGGIGAEVVASGAIRLNDDIAMLERSP
jgi:MOSC domain-containing protein YiiM